MNRNKTLAQEIHQTKPFASVKQEAFLAIQRTADQLQAQVAALLKPFGVSPTQYNVLRILRGAGPEGLRCGDIGERMITREPDITRLLDRMEKSGWIGRRRDTGDRRVVITVITPKGLKLLAEIDGPIAELEKSILPGFPEKKLKTLIELLEEMRGAGES